MATTSMNFQVAGIKYRLRAYEDAHLVAGDALHLEAEPNNEFDPAAIKVLKDELHFGYVPRTHNQLLGEVLSHQPAQIACLVVSAAGTECVARVTWEEYPPIDECIAVIARSASAPSVQTRKALVEQAEELGMTFEELVHTQYDIAKGIKR